MALISSSIPNLINGISQQPPSLRLKTQAENQVNGLSSVVSGLTKRPATEHIGYILESLTSTQQTDIGKAFVHGIRNSDSTLNFLIVQKDGSINIVDSLGVQRTVVNNSGSYLNGITDPKQQLTATTVADYTFLVNKNKTILSDSSSTNTKATGLHNHEALVYVKQGDYSSEYKVKFTKLDTNGVETSDVVTLSVLTRSSNQTGATDVATAKVQFAEKSIQTDRIASHLNFGATIAADFTDDGNSITQPALPSWLDVSEVRGNTLYVGSDSDDFNVEVSDSRGNTHLFVFKDKTQDFNKLPPTGKAGFVIGVNGNNQDGQDDYFVELRQDSASGQYVWKESLSRNVLKSFDASTMPHTIVYNGSQYEIKPASWTERQVGNDETNPFPSFVNFKINDVFFHRNRLGFLSDENVIFSEAGEFFNFFQKTVLALLDAGPIDVAVSNNEVSILRHAVPFNETLLLFSDFAQFKLRAEQVLTPGSVSIDVATRFETNLKAKPVSAGKYVYFPTKRGKHAGVREYFIDIETETNDAADVTAHVPEYIEGEIERLTSSTNEDMILALTDTRPNELFVYRYFWQANEKLQSAWSSWLFEGQVLYSEFDNSDIYIIFRHGDKVSLEVLNLSTDRALEDTVTVPVLLDRRVRLTSASPTVPYSTTGVVYVSEGGGVIPSANVAATLAAGKIVFVGKPYLFTYQFSEQVMRQDREPITTGRLQIRNMAVVYSDTGFFKVVTTTQKNIPVANRNNFIRLFTGRVLGDGLNKLGSVPLATGTYKFGVLGNSKNIAVELQSLSHLPCAFQSAEWEGEFVLRSRRV